MFVVVYACPWYAERDAQGGDEGAERTILAGALNLCEQTLVRMAADLDWTGWRLAGAQAEVAALAEQRQTACAREVVLETQVRHLRSLPAPTAIRPQYPHPITPRRALVNVAGGTVRTHPRPLNFFLRPPTASWRC